MKQKKNIKWLTLPEEHDYPAAISYLTLLYGKNVPLDIVEELKKQDVIHFKAKDIFRASELSLLGVSNSHVVKNLEKIEKGEALSPLLLVRTSKRSDHILKVIIADGYHRLCGVYHFDEDADIPCKIS